MASPVNTWLKRGETMRKHLAVLTLAALAVVATVGPVAAEGREGAGWPGHRFLPEKSTITGLVERTDAGLAIKSGSAEYLVTGKDLSPFVGKKVAATGEITEHGGKKMISVTSARTCEDC
jgi:hypothetical protein